MLQILLKIQQFINLIINTFTQVYNINNLIIKHIQKIINLSMTQTEQNNFFATQVNQHENQQEKIDHVQKPIPVPIQQIKNETIQLYQQKIYPVSLKKLLETFNAYDKSQKGHIPLQQCMKIIESFSHIKKPSEQKFNFYYKLSLSNKDNQCTFDQFLFIFGLCQSDIQNKSTDEQYSYCQKADTRIVDFMRLLNNYRKKCQNQVSYQEAKKSKQKIQQIRQKQFARRKNFLNIIHKRQLQELQNQQKQKFVQFCSTWDQFMNQYQITAMELIKKLSEKQEEQLQEFVVKTKQQLGSRIHYSKQFVDLQDLQKRLVKAQQYQKAEKVRLEIEHLKIIQLQKKQKQDMVKVQLRAQTLKKQHAASMNTLLQKIQKDRNDQSRQRITDSQKLIVKNKTLVTQIKHRHTQALKTLYQSLHNITIEQTRINSSQPYQKARGNNPSSLKQRNY